MNSIKPEIEEYNKYLINKQTVNQNIIKVIETLASNDDVPKFAFHKIMVNTWSSSLEILFDTLSDYFKSSLIPVNPSVQDEISIFYTNNLHLLLKIISLGFSFLYERVIVNIAIIYNDKTSVDFFNKYETITDIVTGVVTKRFNDNQELDLSDFCNDAEFLTKKIHFYKLNLLSNFKILMLRIGKETRSLNLSNNYLRAPPSPILNFFIKGSLTSIDLSNNNVSSKCPLTNFKKIEVTDTVDFFLPLSFKLCSLNQIFVTELFSYKYNLQSLWLEGNPLCKNTESWEYVKMLTSKFPKLSLLDGVKLNSRGVMLPSIKNFLVTPDQRTKAIVEIFISQYFKWFELLGRSKLSIYYLKNATMSITANVPGIIDSHALYYSGLSRNILDPNKAQPEVFNNLLIEGRENIIRTLCQIPRIVHDRTSMNVDVIRNDPKCLIIVVDATCVEIKKRIFLRTRRTFVFSTSYKAKFQTTAFSIRHEMFHISHVPRLDNFMYPPLHEHPLNIHEPTEEEIEDLIKIFSHITYLKKSEADKRLRASNWNIRKALLRVVEKMKVNQLLPDHLMEICEPDTSNQCLILDMKD